MGLSSHLMTDDSYTVDASTPCLARPAGGSASADDAPASLAHALKAQPSAEAEPEPSLLEHHRQIARQVSQLQPRSLGGASMGMCWAAHHAYLAPSPMAYHVNHPRRYPKTDALTRLSPRKPAPCATSLGEAAAAVGVRLRVAKKLRRRQPPADGAAAEGADADADADSESADSARISKPWLDVEWTEEDEAFLASLSTLARSADEREAALSQLRVARAARRESTVPAVKLEERAVAGMVQASALPANVPPQHLAPLPPLLGRALGSQPRSAVARPHTVGITDHSSIANAKLLIEFVRVMREAHRWAVAKRAPAIGLRHLSMLLSSMDALSREAVSRAEPPLVLYAAVDARCDGS
jgi:hypothetical protein